MAWKQEDAEYVLVPAGLFFLFAYHAILLYRVIKHPTTTVIGLNVLNRKAWVSTMMKDSSKTGVLAVQTFRNNIMASSLLATAAVMLSSLIAFIVVNNDGSASILLGSTASMISSFKLLAILACFLIVFLFATQSVRLYSHASFLIGIPVGDEAPMLTVDYVDVAVRKASYSWSIGLRASYFSVPLFMWIFSPIAMFISSLSLLLVLYFVDNVTDSRVYSNRRCTAHEIGLP